MTPDIAPGRIAFAIATYERTQVADKAPFDAFVVGDLAALTTAQQTGLNFLRSHRARPVTRRCCSAGNRFAKIGLRDSAKDTGLEGFIGMLVEPVIASLSQVK